MSELSRDLVEQPGRFARVRKVAADIARLFLQKEQDLPVWRVEKNIEVDPEDAAVATAREHFEVERLIHEI